MQQHIRALVVAVGHFVTGLAHLSRGSLRLLPQRHLFRTDNRACSHVVEFNTMLRRFAKRMTARLISRDDRAARSFLHYALYNRAEPRLSSARTRETCHKLYCHSDNAARYRSSRSILSISVISRALLLSVCLAKPGSCDKIDRHRARG